MYLGLKALHLVAVVTWFAALFYLPRLFVYHAMARDKGDTQAIDYFLVMERKLYRGIMTPSMIAVLLFGGGLLALAPGYLSQGWLHVKLVLVALLIGYHHLCLRYLKQLATQRCNKTQVFFRWFNEAPVLVLLAVVFLAIFKPF